MKDESAHKLRVKSQLCQKEVHMRKETNWCENLMGKLDCLRYY